MTENTIVVLKTNKGTIEIELDHVKAPKTAANFKQYVEDEHYNGLIFHRVINNFMIQGGGMNAAMEEQQTKAPIENEADNGLQNKIGSVAMARTNDPHSASSQFFINVADNDFLNHKDKSNGWGYCVFGRVIAGMEVVDAIKAVETGNRSFHQDVPKEDIVIESATLKATVSE
jgi:peptidyl-prolyl cis-trans isomerase B (cyclophilin B)